mmetsp:Transcript_59799/g.99391  ORF Transcript_59799/g.99391 Transcript_59799/m.99391 type:complete len:127 (+) Transcript_59799:3-383(+)
MRSPSQAGSWHMQCAEKVENQRENRRRINGNLASPVSPRLAKSPWVHGLVEFHFRNGRPLRPQKPGKVLLFAHPAPSLLMLCGSGAAADCGHGAGKVSTQLYREHAAELLDLDIIQRFRRQMSGDV